MEEDMSCPVPVPVFMWMDEPPVEMDEELDEELEEEPVSTEPSAFQ